MGWALLRNAAVVSKFQSPDCKFMTMLNSKCHGKYYNGSTLLSLAAIALLQDGTPSVPSLTSLLPVVDTPTSN